MAARLQAASIFPRRYLEIAASTDTPASDNFWETSRERR